jgi:predicted TPR repeat methyltransferase
MDAHLRAGIAIYNAGRFHAAHDAWEDRWLALDAGDDERFLHGLIQFTAAIHHATGHNWAGACGLAESAREYLADLPAEYRGVNVGEVRRYLATLHADPESIERTPPLRLTHEGCQLTLDDLDFAASAVAAEVLAEAGEGDHATVERAVEYAREDFEADEATSPFVTLVMDFVRDPDNRGIVLQRLTQHTDRRAARDRDVDGLFEP